MDHMDNFLAAKPGPPIIGAGQPGFDFGDRLLSRPACRVKRGAPVEWSFIWDVAGQLDSGVESDSSGEGLRFDSTPLRLIHRAVARQNANNNVKADAPIAIWIATNPESPKTGERGR